MSEASLLESYRQAMEAKAVYVAALPAWVRAWMAWMGVVLPSAFLLAPFRAEARWIVAALIASQGATVAIGMAFGWSRLWGLAHVLFWTPVVVLLWRRWPSLAWTPRLRGRRWRLTGVLRVWLALVLGTMTVSLVFDHADVLRFVSGVR